MRVHPTGKVSLFTGSHSHGQGHETAFAQIVADELGVPMGDIEVVHGDTGRVPFGMGSYGSRSLSVGGSAIVKSAEKVREKMKKIAAHQLEAAVEDIVYDQDAGKLYVKGSPDKSKSIFDVSFASYTAHNLPDGMEPGHGGDQLLMTPPTLHFPNSCHIAYVEIDQDTGEVKIEKYFAVDDVGNVVNPMIVDGQIAGGIVQGVGQALLEEGRLRRERPDDERLKFMEYTMPRAIHFPMIETSRTVTPRPAQPAGRKGRGRDGHDCQHDYHRQRSHGRASSDGH